MNACPKNVLRPLLKGHKTNGMSKEKMVELVLQEVPIEKVVEAMEAYVNREEPADLGVGTMVTYGKKTGKITKSFKRHYALMIDDDEVTVKAAKKKCLALLP